MNVPGQIRMGDDEQQPRPPLSATADKGTIGSTTCLVTCGDSGTRRPCQRVARTESVSGRLR